MLLADTCPSSTRMSEPADTLPEVRRRRRGSVHSILEAAATSLQVAGDLDHLRSSGEASARFVEEARERLRLEGLQDGLDLADLALDVVVFGSYARQEASGESDFDYLVVAYGLYEPVSAARTVLRQADRLRQAPRDRSNVLFESGAGSAPEIAPPGRTGMFGRVVSAPDLVERIGLEQDTNQTQSIRMLLLEESESLLRQDLHDDLLRSIVGRYLSDSEDAKPGPPRFLVNDVIRYWRTLTVDYAAKRHEQLSPEWGLRYLKLIISCKLTYAGTLVSLLSCGEGRPASVEHLVEQFRMPALARLGQLHTMLSERV